jgi:hypothetical protein
MENDTPRRDWVVKRHLNVDALKEYVSRHEISRTQVVGITEPEDGVFTLIFEPTDEQQTRLAADEVQVGEVLDELFGVAVTPVQTPSGAEVETVVAAPIPATPDPLPEPTPS